MGRYGLLDAVSAEALDLALDVELGLVDRIAQALPRIAADHQTAGLRHESAHMADRTAADDPDALHRYAAAPRYIAFDHQQSAPPASAPALAGLALYSCSA